MNGRRVTKGFATKPRSLLIFSLFAAMLISSDCGSGGGSNSGGTPPVAPSITTQPVSPSVSPGQTATFTVVAAGTAPLRYQWQRAGANISGGSLASYTTAATTISDNGSQFDVVVSNSAGTVTSHAATLNVISPSQQPAEPVDITPIDGGAYYLVNQFSGLQADLVSNSQTAGDHIVQAVRSFTDLSQRWGFTKLSGGLWKISDLQSGFCM